MNRVNILGIGVDNCSIEQALDRIEAFVDRDEYAQGVTPNVDHVVKLRRDAAFRDVYESSRLVVADGVPLLWASRVLGTPLKERIAGIDLFERACALAASRGYSIYLLGGNPGAANRALHVLRERHPSLKIAGWHCPPYGFGNDADENARVQDQIRASGADILFVGLGAPKQDKWIHRYGKGTGVSFAIGVGVSFSFVSGEIKRAPVWMQRNGLEWLWRVYSEPSRLWRRYFLEDSKFFYLLSLEVIKMAVRRLTRKISLST